MSPLSALLHRNAHRILLTAIAGAVVALVFSLAQPLRYRATMRLLIIQATSPTLDAFTAVKSAEKVGRNLGRVVASSSFLASVSQANVTIDQSAFPRAEDRRRRAWARMVETSVASETSVLEVRVFHPLQAQARVIAETIGVILVRDIQKYTGSRDLEAQVLDTPIVSRYPVRPNIPLNTALGLLLGGIMGAAYAYLREPKRHAET